MGKFLGSRKPDRDAVAAAMREAAKGGWPEQPMCSLNQRRRFWAWTVATFFGAGFGKPGPGTWGSAAATLLWTIPALLLHLTAAPLAALTLALAALATVLGVPAATIAARESGRKDPGFVVIDEVAGQWLTLLALTLGSAYARLDGAHIVLGFLLFRLFDVTKPFPIRRIEKLPEGWGIVFDDLAAGLYAGLALWLISRWIH
ncbi:phosphatidylglycerophosphatase A [Acidicapsa dinghuensis]|uniref:Phosphatidylglycerophosphatase A n=1 Tax=Acidicapsa dinghuensis TaxID=2218256 RepID=A0ABW1EE72_9BACT|nr:phosphatidylglycerophosphatase A [Acidicapsa dinghuensis]